MCYQVGEAGDRYLLIFENDKLRKIVEKPDFGPAWPYDGSGRPRRPDYLGTRGSDSPIAAPRQAAALDSPSAAIDGT